MSGFDSFLDQYPRGLTEEEMHKEILRDLKSVAQSAGQPSDMQYVRGRVEKSPAGTNGGSEFGPINIPDQYDLNPNAYKQPEGFFDGSSKLFAPQPGMLLSNFQEVLIQVPVSQERLESKYSEGRLGVGRYLRVKISHVPDGTKIYDPLEGRFYKVCVADGENGKPKLWLNERDAEAQNNKYLRYFEPVFPDKGELQEVGAVSAQQVKDHFEKYGDKIKGKDKEGKETESYHIDAGGYFLPRSHTHNRGPVQLTSNASAKVFSNHGGEVTSEDWLVVSGMVAKPDTRRPPRRMETRPDREDQDWWWLIDPENRFPTLWRREEREALFKSLEEEWDTIVGAGNDHPTKEQLDQFNKSVAEVWNAPGNAPNNLTFFGYIDKEARNPKVVNEHGQFEKAYNGMMVRIYDPATSRPMYDHRSRKTTGSDILNPPMFGRFAGGYVIDKDLYQYLKDHGTQLGWTDGPETGDPERNDLLKKAESIFKFDIKNEARSQERGDRSPYLVTAISIAKRDHEMRLGFSHLGKALTTGAMGGTAGAVAGLAAGLLMASTGPVGWAVAGVCALAAGGAGAHVAMKNYQELRFKSLHTYERLAEWPIAKLYEERARDKGLFGVRALREDFALAWEGLRSKVFCWMENREHINRWESSGKGLMILGGLTAVAALTGGVGAFFSVAAIPSLLQTLAIPLGIVGGAVLSTGKGAQVVANMADKGHEHLFYDVYHQVPRAIEANDRFKGHASDYVMRLGGFDMNRTAHIKSYAEEVKKAHEVLEEELLGRKPFGKYHRYNSHIEEAEARKAAAHGRKPTMH